MDQLLAQTSAQTNYVKVGGFSFEVNKNETILEAARRAKISIPHTCGGKGKCLTCRFDVIQGSVGLTSSIENELASQLDGKRLACQCEIKTDVELDFFGPVSNKQEIEIDPPKGKPQKALETLLQTEWSGDRFLRIGNEGAYLSVEPRPNLREAKDRQLLFPKSQTASGSQHEVNASLSALAKSDQQEITTGTLTEAPGFGSEDYSDEDYQAARRREKLLYINIEFTNHCNLACVGCFAGFGDVEDVFDLGEMKQGFNHVRHTKKEMILEEILDVLDQSAELGAKTVDLIGGGEPLGSRMFLPLVEHASKLGLDIEVFTNATLITPSLAKAMAEHNVLPFVKLYSARSWIHDEMVGTDGAWIKAVRGIQNLISAGYGGPNGLPISLETIVVRKNADDLADLWRFGRELGMIPYFERFVGCHYDGDPGNLLSANELKTLWENLWILDRGEYGFTWPLLPLRVGYTCATNFYSLYVNIEGSVRPCSGLFLPLGNVRDQKISEILKTNSIVKDLREYERPADSWCDNCYYYESDRCPGCRGMAQAAGGHMADDPLCFHNLENLKAENDPRESPHLKLSKTK